MKFEFEINLDNIFADQEGTTVQEAIREEVLSRVTSLVKASVNNEFKGAIKPHIDAAVKGELSRLLPMVLDEEHQEVTGWGEKKEVFTIRGRISKFVAEQCVLKDSRYSSDRNAFTQAMCNAIEAMVKEQAAAVKKEIDARFTEQVLKLAQEHLRQRLGVKP